MQSHGVSQTMSTPNTAWQRLWGQRDYRIGLTFFMAFWAFLTVAEWGVAAAHFNHPPPWLKLTAMAPGAAAFGCAGACAWYLLRGWRRQRAAAPAETPTGA